MTQPKKMGLGIGQRHLLKDISEDGSIIITSGTRQAAEALARRGLVTIHRKRCQITEAGRIMVGKISD